MSAPVSVVVPTLDEEVNLPECLRSLAWADEIFVVDSFSRDGACSSTVCFSAS